MPSDQEIRNKYTEKCLESFKTKLNIFLFSKCINGGLEGIRVDDFTSYQINNDDIETYTAVYYQLTLNDTINQLSIREIAQRIDDWKRTENDLLNLMKNTYQVSFAHILPFEAFEKLAKVEECHYCGITLHDINDLIEQRKIFKKHETRGFSMEIDRKFPNKEYSIGNIVACCYWCNNAKTDEFNEDEFKIIAMKISEIWVRRGIAKLKNNWCL